MKIKVSELRSMLIEDFRSNLRGKHGAAFNQAFGQGVRETALALAQHSARTNWKFDGRRFTSVTALTQDCPSHKGMVGEIATIAMLASAQTAFWPTPAARDQDILLGINSPDAFFPVEVKTALMSRQEDSYAPRFVFSGVKTDTDKVFVFVFQDEDFVVGNNPFPKVSYATTAELREVGFTGGTVNIAPESRRETLFGWLYERATTPSAAAGAIRKIIRES